MRLKGLPQTTYISAHNQRHRSSKRFLLIAVSIVCVLVISLAGVFSYTPDTSAPFPYIPPPEGPDCVYIATTTDAFLLSIVGSYEYPMTPYETYRGKSFIFKAVQVPKDTLQAEKNETYAQGRAESFLQIGYFRFVPQDSRELMKLKVGEVVDIIGVCDGLAEGFTTIFVFNNCRFLPAGVAPLPLPGGPALISGGY